MDNLLLGSLSIPVFIGLIILRVHIGLALYLVGFLGYWVMSGNFSHAVTILATQPYATASNFALAVLPLFMLLGTFAGHSGFASDAYEGVKVWLGKTRGGLAITTVIANAIFGAACASSAAAVAVFSKFSVPEMTKMGYKPQLSIGPVAASGVIAQLIPPSVLVIMYCFLTEQSIGRLFIAGILPGLLLTILFCIAIFTMIWRNPGLAPHLTMSYSWKARVSSLRKVWGIGTLAVIIMGGIYGGFVTPQEAGAVGTVAALLIAIILRRLSRKNFMMALQDAAIMGAMVLFIYSGATLFGRFLALTGVPRMLVNTLVNSNLPPMAILIILMFVYLALGCILDSFGILVLTIPLVFPVAQAMGWDLTWFGILIMINLEAGLLTPPVGMNVFVLSAVTGVPALQVFKVVTPFFLMMLLALAVLIAFPQIITILPDIMYK